VRDLKIRLGVLVFPRLAHGQHVVVKLAVYLAQLVDLFGLLRVLEKRADHPHVA
jgi:hypothetical protein